MALDTPAPPRRGSKTTGLNTNFALKAEFYTSSPNPDLKTGTSI